LIGRWIQRIHQVIRTLRSDGGTVTVLRSTSPADRQRWTRFATAPAVEELLGQELDEVAPIVGGGRGPCHGSSLVHRANGSAGKIGS